MSGLLGSILGGVGSIIGAGINASSQKSANDTNIKLQQQQQAYDTQMWNAQNEYNSPAAVKQRELDAGLNPFLDVQNAGSVSAAGSPPTVQPAQVQPVNYGNMFMSAISGFLQAMTAQSESTKALADAQQSSAEAHRIDSLTPVQFDLLKSQNRLTDWQAKDTMSDQALKQQLTGESSQREANLKQENDFRVFTNSLYQKYAESLTINQVNKLADECKNIVADTKLKKAQYNLTDEQVRTEVSKQVVNYAHANNLNVDSQSIAAHIVPDILNEDEETRESLTRQDRNRAEAANIRNDTYNHNMTDEGKLVGHTISNALSLGTGAWFNNSLKPKPSKTVRVSRMSHYNHRGKLTGETDYDYGEY